MLNLAKLPVRKSNVALRVSKGHFATNHSHINYLIDVTFQKSRLSEAQAVAKALVKQYVTSTIVDTIVCLDGMQVVGACLAEELTKAGPSMPIRRFTSLPRSSAANPSSSSGRTSSLCWQESMF